MHFNSFDFEYHSLSQPTFVDLLCKFLLYMIGDEKKYRYHDGPALVYFSGPWENVLILWQYLIFYWFKIIQITNKSNLTLPDRTCLVSPNPGLSNVRLAGHIRPAKHFNVARINNVRY